MQLTAGINIHALSLLAFKFIFPPSNVYKRLFLRGTESTNGYGSPEKLDNELESLFKRAVSLNLTAQNMKKRV